jgi:hypothetical protein
MADIMGRFIAQSGFHSKKPQLDFLKDFERVMTNINAEIRHIENATADGLLEAMEHVHRKADEIIPVRTGAMRASWFTVSNGSKQTPNTFAIKAGKNETLTPSSQKKVARITGDYSAAVAEAKSEVESSTGPMVIGGYAAYYASFVHEGIAGTSTIQHLTRPGSQLEWLKKAFIDSTGTIMKILQRKVRVR